MTPTMHFDVTLHVVIVHCILSSCIVFCHYKDEPPIETLFCHCERSEAIFLS
ncbi:MAG: hypothetical protein U0586_08945 [Candidatus Brocadiaceae bacterium]